ncbi:hypothetical protein ACTXJR_15925 [Glutamicibacter ardleyensis]|uniref:hypothetical protein n=1 Tax=Glutamicibacter ardleyensis TaxID=225894 RepID=UPI003FB6BE00
MVNLLRALPGSQLTELRPAHDGAQSLVLENEHSDANVDLPQRGLSLGNRPWHLFEAPHHSWKAAE